MLNKNVPVCPYPKTSNEKQSLQTKKAATKKRKKMEGKTKKDSYLPIWRRRRRSIRRSILPHLKKPETS
jgi:hypothetical protein